MKQIHYLILFVISLVPAFFLFQRTSIIGADSYYFFNAICSITPNLNAPYFSQIFMQFLPCNIYAIFFINWLAIFLCSIIVAKIGELFHKNGWLAGIFIYLCPYFVLELVKFEDDLLAFPILFLALYFWLKKDRIKALVLVGLAFLFWQGAVIYLLPFSASIPMAFIMAVLLCLWFYGGHVFHNFEMLWTAKGAMENYPIIGLLYLGPLLLGLIPFVLRFLEQNPMTRLFQRMPVYWKELTIFMGMAFLDSKFVLHAMPLIAVSCVDYFNGLGEAHKKYMLGFFVFIVLLFTCMNLPKQVPNEDVWNAIHEAKALSDDLNRPLMNSFGFGYWMQYLGLEPSAYGWYSEQDFNGSVIVSSREENCETFKKFGRYKVQVC